MPLFETLAKATSEEDVKAAYVKALGLKNVRRNLIDIQTNEVWFEAKLGSKCSVYYMFTEPSATSFVRRFTPTAFSVPDTIPLNKSTVDLLSGIAARP